MSLHARGPISQNVTFNDAEDYATVYGQMISGELLRVFGEPTPPGVWFRIVRSEHGKAIIETRRDVPAPREMTSRLVSPLPERNSARDCEQRGGSHVRNHVTGRCALCGAPNSEIYEKCCEALDHLGRCDGVQPTDAALAVAAARRAIAEAMSYLAASDA